MVNNFTFAYFRFFGLMLLISDFESSGVLIDGAMSSSCSVVILHSMMELFFDKHITDDLFVFKDSFKPLIFASNVSLEMQLAISSKPTILLHVYVRNAHVRMCIIVGDKRSPQS